ncbi:replication initiation protein, partial [Marisediminitalea aggregata]|nr:replication initiation protein [Marisediminitalea aggregata]
MNKQQALVACVAMLVFSTVAGAEESVCFGTTGNGRLENGVKLPTSGENYEGYSTIARLAGRTYVHSTVRDIVLSAYTALE